MVGQSSKSRKNGSLKLSVFPTNLGWFGLLGQGNLTIRLTIGHPSEESARCAAVDAAVEESDIGGTVETADWNPDLRRRLQRYAQGEPVAFDDIDVSLPPLTDFQQAVIEATRAISFGETRTYAELAEAAGYPRAARAVGNVMASNRVPVVIPCHRVVAAGNKWGGFSAPTGVDLKRQMLALETEAQQVVGSAS